MGAVVENEATNPPRNPQKALTEVRPNKIVKKSREKKQLKNVEVNAVIEAVENDSPESEDTQEARDKKAQGIVINGRTYTCATCKTGHRVGICKHARERPMTATHPPGRPPAGAPKKVVCDCPKQCNCKKRDCKCARHCSCTQLMYMLVYVPAPDEGEDAVEENGAWKLGQQVTTDLKGNILTPEQIKERLQQKEVRKTLTPEKRITSVPSSHLIPPRTRSSPKAESKPKESGGCCKHKENVAIRNIVAEASLQTGRMAKATADGCNCGHACTCAFCPQHPNNSTSMHMARQQAMHFANQPYNSDPQSIVSFMPAMPQGASCMGGLPQFAVSRFAQQPSFIDLQRAFPQPGYVIGYPIWSTRTDTAGYPMAPFPMQPHFVPNMSMLNGDSLNTLQPPILTPTVGMSESELPMLDFSQDEFGIGNAFVASAGPGGWDDDLMSSNIWPMASSVTTPNVNNIMEVPDLVSGSTRNSELPTTPIPRDTAFRFPTHLNILDENNYFDTTNAASLAPEAASEEQPRLLQKSCCATPYEAMPVVENRDYEETYFLPTTESVSPVAIQPHG